MTLLKMIHLTSAVGSQFISAGGVVDILDSSILLGSGAGEEDEVGAGKRFPGASPRDVPQI